MRNVTFHPNCVPPKTEMLQLTIAAARRIFVRNVKAGFYIREYYEKTFGPGVSVQIFSTRPT